MNRNIHYLVLCLFTSLCCAGYTAAAQDCKISVINNNESGNKVFVAVLQGEELELLYPPIGIHLAKGKTWHAQCSLKGENKCYISWFTHRTMPPARHKFVGVTCGSTYQITTETSDLI